MNTEPILLGLAPAMVSALVLAVANLGKAFGLELTQDQINAINGVVSPLMIVLFAIGAWWARRNATPVANPTLPAGTTVNVVQPNDEPNTTTTV